MTVYVDPLLPYGHVEYKGKKYGPRWCHMVSDADDPRAELKAFAALLFTKGPAWILPTVADATGIRHANEWLQDKGGASLPHYDLTPAKRERALQLGAQEITHLQLATITHNYNAHRLIAEAKQQARELVADIEQSTVPEK